MRFAIRIPLSLVVPADTPYMFLALDGLLVRSRSYMVNDPLLAAALARVAAQLGYRVAAERYHVEDGEIKFMIELSKEEACAIRRHYLEILREVEWLRDHWESRLKNGEAYCRECLESRIAALDALMLVLKAVDDQAECS